MNKKLNIYFSGSISGGRDDSDIYASIIHYLKQYGHVLTAYIGDSNLLQTGEDSITDHEIWERDIEWLHQSDVLVAEVTQPSLGVGYEIALSNQLPIPVLALFRPSSGKRLSGMIAGDPNVTVVRYDQVNSCTLAVDGFMTKLGYKKV